MINIGIIGCGSVAQLRHAPEYAANPYCRIKAVTDFNAERANELAKLYECITYDSYQQLLSDDEIDAVSICTANNSHANNALN